MNNLFYTTSVEKDSLLLSEQEAVHCSLVLRKKVGDLIQVIDGKGNHFTCGIDSINKRGVRCSILQTKHHDLEERNIIAIAPTKNRDRLEWMIEKLVEIGVNKVILMNTTNTERNRTNTDRLDKKVISAVKQSLRFYKPDVEELEFHEVLKIDASNKFIAHCHKDLESTILSNKTMGDNLILIGPEGDFTKQEVVSAFEAGFEGLSLGDFRLRTETAAIVALSRFS